MKYDTVSVAATNNWYGNDGTWSTFALQLGTPRQGQQAQQVEVLPATSMQSIWAVLPMGCWNQPLTPTQCATSRGGFFAPNSSTTSQPINGSSWWSWEQLTFISEQYLDGNYSESASTQIAVVSRDRVALGETSLPNQLIQSYAAKLPYMGLLGLTSRANNFTDYDGSQLTFPSLLGSLATNKSSPTSSYWGYTAGFYNNYPLPYAGSLTFGGYDAARGNQKDVLTVDLAFPSPRDTSVYLSGINVKNPLSPFTPAQNLPLFMYIDSVVPEIWLPTPACKVFEDAFGLTWDESRQLYMISDTENDRLEQLNATVELKLSAYPQSTDSITISLPYTAFSQSISFPLAGITDGTVLRYFPLKRASEDPQDYQFILGRVFLQHAYLAVDYSREKFYVSQAQFPPDQRETNITTVYPKGVQPPNPIITTYFLGPRPLPPADIAGIAVGAVCFVAIALALLWWFLYRPWARNRKNRPVSKSTEGEPRDFVGYYGDEEKHKAEDEMYEKRELEANDTTRASITSRHEMPSPPLPQYSPGSPGSPHSHLRNISAESAELPGDYLTARRLSPASGGPWELPADGEHERPTSPIEMGFGSIRSPNPSTNF